MAKVSPQRRQVSLALVRNNTLFRAEANEPKGRGIRIVNLIDEKKYSELEQAAKQLKDESAMLEFLHLMREAYNLQHVFFAILDQESKSFTKMCGTFPVEWRDYYERHRLSLVDPIFKRSILQTPVVWNKMDDLTKEEAALMKVRAEHGIGPNGMTIPLVSSDGNISVLSLTGKVETDGDSWMKRAQVLFKEFREIGMIMHAAYLRLNGLQPPKVELSTRHIDCIRMLGHGMSLPEVAQFQGLSQKSAKNYIKEARARLRARNNAQLLFNAIQLGFIEI
jgi:DNA-binding CsgD family transcriptional regulator